MGASKPSRRDVQKTADFVPFVTNPARRESDRSRSIGRSERGALSRKSMDAMPNRTKQRRSGGLTLLLYQRTLHPELFRILGTDQVQRRAYEADIWLVEGGHV